MPPHIEVSDHAVLRYVQRVDPLATRSAIEERVRDSISASQDTVKWLGTREGGKHKWKFTTKHQMQIARRDRVNQCVYLIRVVAKDRWSVVTVLSADQIRSLQTAYRK